MRHERYGRLATTQDLLLFDMLIEQQRTNELLKELLARTPEPAKTEVPKQGRRRAPVLDDLTRSATEPEKKAEPEQELPQLPDPVDATLTQLLDDSSNTDE